MCTCLHLHPLCSQFFFLANFIPQPYQDISITNKHYGTSSQTLANSKTKKYRISNSNCIGVVVKWATVASNKDVNTAVTHTEVIHSIMTKTVEPNRLWSLSGWWHNLANVSIKAIWHKSTWGEIYDDIKTSIFRLVQSTPDQYTSKIYMV